MEDVKVYPPALASNGWVFKEKCMCSGVRKFKFANVKYPGFIVEWWVKYFKFRITDQGSVYQTLTSLTDLDNSLKTFARLHPVTTTTATVQAETAKPLAQAAKTVEPEPVTVEPEPVTAEDTEKTTEDKKLTNDDSKVSKKSAKKTDAKDEAAKRDQLN